MNRSKADTAMVRLDKSTIARLKKLQEQLDGAEGMHQYYARDWHGRLGLSLDSVVRVLLDREEDHRRRSSVKGRTDRIGRPLTEDDA